MQIRLSARRVNQRSLRGGLPASGRDQMGWSLVATLAMMVVISTFVAAMYAALLPAYSHIVNLRYKDAARSVNEGAVDSLLAQINTSTFTPPAAFGGSTVQTSTVTQGGADYTVNTTVKDLGSGPGNGGPPTNCAFYNAANVLPYYALSANVVKGTLNRTLTVVLNPINPAGGGNNTPNPFFSVATGVGTVNEVGLACINGYNLPAGWKNPYQFADTQVQKGITWQIGNGNLGRSQIIAGSQFEFWHPGNSPPQLPPITNALTYEPFTQIMGNIYSNYQDQNGANGNGYWPRNQLSSINSGPNVPGGANNSQFGAPASSNANVFGAFNGQVLPSGAGVPSGYQQSQTAGSIPIPNYTSGTQPNNGSGSPNINPNWGFNAVAGSNGGNLPVPGTSNGGNAYGGPNGTPNTGGYITSPGAGTAGALDTWQFPAPTVSAAPGAPIGTPQPATGGLGAPNTTGTYFSNAPQTVVINGGTLIISSSATTVPASLSVGQNQTVTIPPGNYNLSSLQVVNNGSIQVNPNVAGQTQFFVNPVGAGQGTNGAIYVDNTSNVNTIWSGNSQLTGGNGFTTSGTQGFGAALPNGQPAVNTANPITETGGSCLNLVINSNASCNMLFAGQTRALVNAPNANVNVGYMPNPNNSTTYTPNSYNAPNAYMTNDANFYGAIISANTSVVSDYQNGAGAYLHYDVNLRTMKVSPTPGQPVQLGQVPLGFYDPWQWFVPGNGQQPATQFRAVSWQEQLGAW